MTQWDWNQDPSNVKHWQPGDQVWIDSTLYVVERFDDGEIVMKRHDPIVIRSADVR